ncbi:hypothetical protein T484DRAFT_1893037, partial [Baffinella frigidus]
MGIVGATSSAESTGHRCPVVPGPAGPGARSGEPLVPGRAPAGHMAGAAGHPAGAPGRVPGPPGRWPAGHPAGHGRVPGRASGYPAGYPAGHPGVRGAGKLLWVGGSFAGGRVGFLGAGAARLAGGPVGAGDIPFEESKRQTDKIMQCRDVRALAEIVAELGWRFSHVNVNTAWLMLARLRPGEEDGVVAAALQTCTPKVLGEMDGRQLANLLHSAATLHDSGRPRADDELVEKMASRSLEVLRTQPKSFNEQAVANLMWALAKLG